MRIEGIPFAEFDAMSPFDHAALYAAIRDRENGDDERMATIACAIINSFVAEGGRTIEPADLFSHIPRLRDRRSRVDIGEQVRRVAAGLGAKGTNLA